MSMLYQGTPLSSSGSVDDDNFVKIDSRGKTPKGDVISGRAERFIIEATHASQDLQVSFDGGTTYITVAHGTNKEFYASVEFFHLKGTGDATTYTVVFFIRYVE